MGAFFVGADEGLTRFRWFARAVEKRGRPAESSRLRETTDTLRPHYKY